MWNYAGAVLSFWKVNDAAIKSFFLYSKLIHPTGHTVKQFGRWDVVTVLRTRDKDSSIPYGPDIRFTNISVNSAHWALSMIFDLIYSSLMSQVIEVSLPPPSPVELLTAWNDKPPLHASPTSKSNEIVLLEISLQSIGPALGSDCTFKRRCLPARLPRLLQQKKRKRTKTIRIRASETAREADTNEHAGAFHPESD